MRSRAATLFLSVLIAGGCASVHRTGQAPSTCTTIPSIIGTWRSYRLSQVGPAWMTMTLGCDCTSRVTAQLLFTRYSEEGYYRIEDRTIVFIRKNSTTQWPFAFVDGRLTVTEAATEQHSYEQVASKQCP